MVNILVQHTWTAHTVFTLFTAFFASDKQGCSETKNAAATYINMWFCQHSQQEHHEHTHIYIHTLTH